MGGYLLLDGFARLAEGDRIMKVIVAGSRTIVSYTLVANAIQDSGFKVTEVISGTARGVDQLGELWAKNQTPPIPVRRFPANWNRYGRTAGMKRNEEMANYAEALVAVWDGKSKGTRGMIRIAQEKGLRVHAVNFMSEAVLRARDLL